MYIRCCTINLFSKGWFPAKFVEILDERSKEYSRAGDDAISASVTDLVRGTLCPAIKAILQHGMRSTSLLGMLRGYGNDLIHGESCW